MGDERKPVKISPEIWEQIKDWQNAERKRTGVEPTQGQLIEQAWKAFVNPEQNSADLGHDSSEAYSSSNRSLHDKLEEILNSGDEMTIAAVVPNIEIFYARLKPATARRRTGS